MPLIEITPLPIFTVPSALVPSTEIVPEEDLRSKVKSSILFVKSKSMAPELVLNEESPVTVTSVPLWLPELDRKSRVPSVSVSVIPPEEDSAVMEPFIDV